MARSLARLAGPADLAPTRVWMEVRMTRRVEAPAPDSPGAGAHRGRPTPHSLKSESESVSRRTLRRARRALAPRPALRVPDARSAKGASTTGRSTTYQARSSPGLRSRSGSNPLGAQKESLRGAT